MPALKLDLVTQTTEDEEEIAGDDDEDVVVGRFWFGSRPPTQHQAKDQE